MQLRISQKTIKKYPFQAASATAEKQVANGNVLGGHIGIAQGYLVYTFFVVNPENQTGYKVIVDAGNGQVLYTSQGNALGTFGHGGLGMFGHGGLGTFGQDGVKWMRHGFNGFGGPGDDRGLGLNQTGYSQ